MREVRTEIEINASASDVWQVLTDFSHYPDWNPFVRHISGELVDGAELNVTIASLFNIPPLAWADAQTRSARWISLLRAP